MKSDNLRRKLENTDDETLKRLIFTVASAAGMSAEKAAELVTNLPELRKKISKMDEVQLATALASMGNEGAANVLKRLGIDNKKL